MNTYQVIDEKNWERANALDYLYAYLTYQFREKG